MRVRVSAVSYSNTLPFLYGIKASSVQENIDLSLDMPADCAKKLLNDEVDIGLVPVAIIPQLKESYILSDYCIGANGKVDTVALYSNVPLKEIEEVYLDYQSKTSVTLVKILAQHYWKISPRWIKANEGFESNVKDNTAVVVIGDRTFDMKHEYKYDLAEEWKKYTGLPFVFACWVANKKIPKHFVDEFNLALQFGVERIDKVVQNASHIEISKERLVDYLKNKISYHLNIDKQKALRKFLEFVS